MRGLSRSEMLARSAEIGRACYRHRLPDEQQIEATVRGRRSSTCTTTFAKAVDSRGEICAARAPAPDVAESVIAVPVRRDLHVPAGELNLSFPHNARASLV
jgi:hypothetical protein